jgi:hypothetical protein
MAAGVVELVHTSSGLRVKSVLNVPDVDLWLKAGWWGIIVDIATKHTTFNAGNTAEVRHFCGLALKHARGYDYNLLAVKINGIVLKIDRRVGVDRMMYDYNMKLDKLRGKYAKHFQAVRVCVKDE